MNCGLASDEWQEKFTHTPLHPLFSVVFLSKVTSSGLTEITNLMGHVGINFDSPLLM